jgi:hypothetical protein
MLKQATPLRLRNKLLLSLVILICGSTLSKAQTLDPSKNFEVACIGFYNIENLFDTLDTPNVLDTEFSPLGEKNWNSERYHYKLKNNSRVISEMGKEISPDGIAVLGLSEIENRQVIEDLIKTEALKDRNFQIVHYDSPDRRGVDVALIYQPKYFKVASTKSYPLTLPNDTSFKTRDQLLVTGDLLGERIHFIVCHWPSRRGGESRSAPLRMAAALVSRHIIDSLATADPAAKVILMGDLNDDPNNKSITKGMRACGKITKLKDGQLFNASEESYRKGIGTLAWKDSWNLFDQMILTQGLVDNTNTFADFRFYKFKVFNKAYLAQTEGPWKGYPFRTYVGNDFKGGYSDHFPVYTVLIREKK